MLRRSRQSSLVHLRKGSLTQQLIEEDDVVLAITRYPLPLGCIVRIRSLGYLRLRHILRPMLQVLLLFLILLYQIS